MNKLKEIIRYECTTSFKAIWIFYAIQYAFIGLITVIIGVSMGSFQKVGTNALEVNSAIFACVMGGMGFHEDFRMLIQNGFTRKYIFIATFSLFAFMAGILALVDTVVGNSLHYVLPGYSSMYGSIYGYGRLLTNWMWLFIFYLLMCSIFYTALLVINKLGKLRSLYLGVGMTGAALLVTAFFRFVLPSETAGRIGRIAAEAMGFSGGGAVNRVTPLLTLLLLAGIFGAVSYAVIRRTELA